MNAKIISFVFLAICGLVGCDRSTPPAPPAAQIDAMLSTATSIVAPGDPIVFALTLTNGESEPMIVVAPGDGSEYGWRTPVITWVVRDEDGKVVTNGLGGRCGNMEPLRGDEIVTLQPGGSISWLDRLWIRDFSYVPGEYTVSIEYRHEPKLENVFWGTAGVPELWLLRQSKGFSVVSNSVKILVKDQAIARV